MAEKSLGTKPGPVLPPPSPPPATSSLSTTLAVPYFPGSSRRSQEPETASKPSSYVMDLAEEIYVIREEGTNVDCRASDYIRWFHERIRNDSIEASKLTPIILSPSPRPVK
ncbi:hypothetical protein NE237_019843 [Protea cynaroides]|uniref:Uncharacterized protein n=1 Tax=Protea cynaroides TaxID=273540 RepID=A0A9Q0H7X6_9MAGN|nr:hypothetical protein NE237_019843 [Protea cynaroides]